MNLAIPEINGNRYKKNSTLHTERVIVKLNEKKEKWETIANETLKQCKKRLIKLQVSPISKFKDIGDTSVSFTPLHCFNVCAYCFPFFFFSFENI